MFYAQTPQPWRVSEQLLLSIVSPRQIILMTAASYRSGVHVLWAGNRRS